MKWDALPQVRSPVGRPLSDLLEEGPPRQDLPGYEAVYRDFVDYILRCTHRIWEQKNPGLCRTHYSQDCPVHMLSGPVIGAEVVTQNTTNTLSQVSDRQVIGEDVIWSDDGDGLLYSSHRIVSRGTHLGDDPLMGEATRREVGVTTIADCACRENRIVEEWLVRDNGRAVLQSGGDLWETARRQAEADREGDADRHSWRSAALSRVRRTGDCSIPDNHPAAAPAAMLRQALIDDLPGEASQSLSPAVEVRWPTNRHGFGQGYWVGCITQLRACLHQPSLAIEHVAARPLPGKDIAVAVRWSLAGRHDGMGVWGAQTGRDILLMAISHYRLRAGAVIEDITVFDELAVLRQIAGGLGA